MAHQALIVTLGALALAAAVACSGSSSSGFTMTGDGGGGSSSGEGGGGGKTDAQPILGGGGSSEGGVGTTTSDDCPESAKLVYVTGEGAKLYSFYPPTLTFTLRGTLSCLSSPTHMTVDRTGTAWVVSNSQLYKASTADASCSAVSTWTPQLTSFSDFALTFLGTTNATDNTLYMMGADVTGAAVLGKFDVPSGVVTTIAKPDVALGRGDMTTNGDGTLYFLMNEAPETGLDLYELNPTNGGILKNIVPMAPTGGDQALAFYGGSFYAFENGVIYQVDPKLGTTKSLGPAPQLVTGAGQSTCVPTVPPSSK